MNIRGSVKELTEKYNTNDPFKIADHLGIKVNLFPFKDVKGLIISLGSTQHVGINVNLPREEQKFILAHEIGHHQLHSPQYNYFYIRDYTYFFNGKYERQANLFAFFLLAGCSYPGQVEKCEKHLVREATLKYITDH